MCKIETFVAVYGLQISALKQSRPANFIRAATQLFYPCKLFTKVIFPVHRQIFQEVLDINYAYKE